MMQHGMAWHRAWHGVPLQICMAWHAAAAQHPLDYPACCHVPPALPLALLPPPISQAVDLGLSGLVDAQLGRPLDKALQCSAWGEVRAAEEWVWQEAAAMAGLAMPRACHDPCHLQWQGRAGQGRA